MRGFGAALLLAAAGAGWSDLSADPPPAPSAAGSVGAGGGGSDGGDDGGCMAVDAAGALRGVGERETKRANKRERQR